MTPELAGLIALFGTQIALGVALFGAIKWSADRSERRSERIESEVSGLRTEQNRRFERVETDLSELKAGQARLEGMFEGAFERIPRVRREYQDDDGGGVAAESPTSYDPRQP